MTNAGKKSKVVTDMKKNRLHIIVKGTVNKKEIENIYTEIRFGIADLQPGFDVITDMTEAKIGHLNGIPTFNKIASYLQTREVRRIVRIADKPKIIVKQLTRLTALIKGYRPVYVKNMEEAEEVLKD